MFQEQLRLVWIESVYVERVRVERVRRESVCREHVCKAFVYVSKQTCRCSGVQECWKGKPGRRRSGLEYIPDQQTSNQPLP